MAGCVRVRKGVGAGRWMGGVGGVAVWLVRWEAMGGTNWEGCGRGGKCRMSVIGGGSGVCEGGMWAAFTLSREVVYGLPFFCTVISFSDLLITGYGPS